MNKTRQPFAILGMLFLMGTLLLACSSNKNNQGSSAATTAPDAQATAEAAATTRSHTDYKGHTAEIPVNPQRIIYSGETYGDLLALGVQAIGYPLSMGRARSSRTS